MKVSTRESVFERDNWQCQYCRRKSAVHIDHLIPIALRRRHRLGDDDERFLTASCADCNWRKGTRRLIPESRAEVFDELPGSGWRIWNGDPKKIAGAYR